MSTEKNSYLSEWTQTIKGEPASKANSRRLVLIKGKSRFIKSKKALDYCKEFESQVVPPLEPICGDVKMAITIWYKTRRPDLDPSLIMDLLQKVGVIENDRQIKEIHAVHQLDREFPRSAIRITTLEKS
jgi:Holliday junction resolvase RusA-like endonuclease|tara:strand:+ start:106 stop:492 length:387 start_codon:yes stop_codon:yes gene_type:complete